LCELTAPDFIATAAAVGCKHVSLFVSSAATSLVCEVIKAEDCDSVRGMLDDHGITCTSAEYILLEPASNVAEFRRVLEMGARLGAPRASVCVMDPQRNRALDNFSALCELGRDLGLQLGLEFMAISEVGPIKDAVAFLAAAAQPNAGLVVDALHLARTGGVWSDLRQVPDGLICYMQICDGPLWVPADLVLAEIVHNRGIPGEGGLALAELFSMAPAGVQIDAEVPLEALRARGVPPLERARRIMAGSRKVLEMAQAIRSQAHAVLS